MSQPYVGEIRMFAGNFPPNGWAFCNGQVLPISENETLFNLIGTTYGGDGEETFALPNLQSRLPIHAGQGPGISQNYQLGEMSGVESVTLTQQTTPIHSHPMLASQTTAQNPQPNDGVVAQSASLQPYITDVGQVAMAANAVTPVGGSQPHDNMHPFVCINFIISLFGIFPHQ